jgi:hypothetical protein
VNTSKKTIIQPRCKIRVPEEIFTVCEESFIVTVCKERVPPWYRWETKKSPRNPWMPLFPCQAAEHWQEMKCLSTLIRPALHAVIYVLLHNYKAHSPSWEEESRLGSQKYPALMEPRSCCYVANMRPARGSESGHAMTPWSFEISFMLAHLRQKFYVAFSLHANNLYAFQISPIRSTYPVNFTNLDFID